MTPLPIETLGRLPDTLGETARVYLQPIVLVPPGGTAGRPLAGGPRSFAACRVYLREPGRVSTLVAGIEEIEAWGDGQPAATAGRVRRLLTSLGAARPAAPGQAPALMGILNVTPDSFTDGGATIDPPRAEQRLRQLVAEGAAIVDLGGESTRPGASPVSPVDEEARLAPLLKRLATEPAILGGAALSIDTRHARVMRAGLAAGAAILNDVSALEDDPESLPVAAASRARVVLMHKQGEPGDMNREPAYENAPLDVFDYLEGRIAACEAAGLGRERLIVDPGIGFGKGSEHNLAILRALALYHGLGCPILLGVSRKGLTGALDRAYAPGERLPGSLAAALFAAGQGVQILRVHDVAATDQALRVWRHLQEPWA